MTCYNCGQAGHIVRNCPMPRQDHALGSHARLRIVVDLANLTAALKQELSTKLNKTAEVIRAVPGLLMKKGVSGIDPKALYDTVAVDSQPEDTHGAALEAGNPLDSLHGSLAKEGFKMITLEIPRDAPTRMQKGVDVAIAVELLRLCGGLRPIGDDGAKHMGKQQHIVLVSADADFKPAIEALLEAVPDAKVWVIGHTNCIGNDYEDWLKSQSRTRFVRLQDLVVPLTKKELIALKGPVNAGALSTLICDKAKKLLEDRPELEEIVFKYNENITAWDSLTPNHMTQIANAARDCEDVASRVTEMWFDHTYRRFDDAHLQVFIDEVFPAFPWLYQLHISHTSITWNGLLKVLGVVASEARYLYVNVTACKSLTRSTKRLPPGCWLRYYNKPKHDTHATATICTSSGGTFVIKLCVYPDDPLPFVESAAA